MSAALEFRSAEALAAHYAAVRSRMGVRETRLTIIPGERVLDAATRRALNSRVLYDEPAGPPRPKSPRKLRSASPHSLARRIFEECVLEYGLQIDDVLGRSRQPDLSRCRQQICWEMKELTDWSLPRIARYLGYDHSTILYGIRRHQARIDAGEVTASDRVAALRRETPP